MTTTHSSISQDYFDELCIENHELFEGNVNDAVQETIEQLKGTALEHISWTFPTGDNRTKIQAFQLALNESNGAALLEYIDESSSSPVEETTMFRHLFLVQDGFAKLCQSYCGWNATSAKRSSSSPTNNAKVDTDDVGGPFPATTTGQQQSQLLLRFKPRFPP
jgi:hypothetical protein